MYFCNIRFLFLTNIKRLKLHSYRFRLELHCACVKPAGCKSPVYTHASLQIFYCVLVRRSSNISISFLHAWPQVQLVHFGCVPIRQYTWNAVPGLRHAKRTLKPRLHQVARQHVAGNKQHVAGNKIVASLLPVCCWIQRDTLPRYRQHVVGNKQHVAGKHVACCRQHVARPRNT